MANFYLRDDGTVFTITCTSAGQNPSNPAKIELENVTGTGGLQSSQLVHKPAYSFNNRDFMDVNTITINPASRAINTHWTITAH